MTYAEYLKSLGTGDEEIKLLDTAAGRRAYEKMQSDLASAQTLATEEKNKAVAYNERVNAWFEEQKEERAKLERELIVTRGNETRARTALLEAQRLGLLDVAKDLGYDPAANANANANANADANANKNPVFDPEKYTREVILPLAEREGDAIAVAQDIAAEHAVLFPNKPLKFRELRIKARDAKKPLEQVWMEDYGVVAAREARVKAAHDKEIADAKEAGRKEADTAWAARMANPDQRIPVESKSPFAPRPDTGRDKQPWERGSDDQNAADRVKRTTQHVLSTLTH